MFWKSKLEKTRIAFENKYGSDIIERIILMSMAIVRCLSDKGYSYEDDAVSIRLHYFSHPEYRDMEIYTRSEETCEKRVFYCSFSADNELEKLFELKTDENVEWFPYVVTLYMIIRERYEELAVVENTAMEIIKMIRAILKSPLAAGPNKCAYGELQLERYGTRTLGYQIRVEMSNIWKFWASCDGLEIVERKGAIHFEEPDDLQAVKEGKEPVGEWYKLLIDLYKLAENVNNLPREQQSLIRMREKIQELSS